jgi:hypothetical protein
MLPLYLCTSNLKRKQQNGLPQVLNKNLILKFQIMITTTNVPFVSITMMFDDVNGF